MTSIEALAPNVVATGDTLPPACLRPSRKEELLQHVWAGISEGNGALLRSVSLLRHALGQRDARDGIIRTYTRRGYRFCMSVRDEAQGS